MSWSHTRRERTVLRDMHGRAIERMAPCDVHYRGAWHRGHVVAVLRVRIDVEVILFGTYAPRRFLVHPMQLAVIGPTYEDVDRDLAARATASAERTRFLPEPDPDPES